MKRIIDLSDKKIIVTGASSGIGKAVSIILSQVGAKVVLIGRNEQRLQETISQMECPSTHDCFCSDLTKLNNIQNLVQQCVEKDGTKLNGLVYCAGVANVVPLKLIDYNGLDADMSLNYYAFIEMVKELTKRKNHELPCSIVGISSVAAQQGGKCQTVYASSKAAMDASVITLSKELASKRIRINTICPGIISIRDELSKKKGIQSMEELEDLQVLGLGKPEDIANLAAFLLSTAAGFITGQNIRVDGGGPKSEWF